MNIIYLNSNDTQDLLEIVSWTDHNVQDYKMDFDWPACRLKFTFLNNSDAAFFALKWIQ